MKEPGMSDLPEDPQEDTSETPMTEEGQPEPMAETVNIPMSALQGKNVKAGDTITLRVTAVNDDGVQAEMDDSAADKGDGYESAGEQIDAMPDTGY